jgi:hypothetical protein
MSTILAIWEVKIRMITAPCHPHQQFSKTPTSMGKKMGMVAHTSDPAGCLKLEDCSLGKK